MLAWLGQKGVSSPSSGPRQKGTGSGAASPSGALGGASPPPEWERGVLAAPAPQEEERVW